MRLLIDMDTNFELLSLPTWESPIIHPSGLPGLVICFLVGKGTVIASCKIAIELLYCNQELYCDRGIKLQECNSL